MSKTSPECIQEWNVSLLSTWIHTSTEFPWGLQTEWEVLTCVHLSLAGWQSMNLPSPVVRKLQLRIMSLFKKEIKELSNRKDFLSCIIFDGPFCLLNRERKTWVKRKNSPWLRASNPLHSPLPGLYGPWKAAVVSGSLLTAVSLEPPVPSTVPDRI